MSTRDRITSLFNEAGRELSHDRGIVSRYEIRQGHDIHAYYDLIVADEVLHVQGYPGMSNENEMMIAARVMNGKLLDEIRRDGKVSIGNEHEAVVHQFRHMVGGIYVPYSQQAVNGILSSCIHENHTRYFINAIGGMAPHLNRIRDIMEEAKHGK